jgi:hypothetical protein
MTPRGCSPEPDGSADVDGSDGGEAPADVAPDLGADGADGGAAETVRSDAGGA